MSLVSRFTVPQEQIRGSGPRDLALGLERGMLKSGSAVFGAPAEVVGPACAPPVIPANPPTRECLALYGTMKCYDEYVNDIIRGAVGVINAGKRPRANWSVFRRSHSVDSLPCFVRHVVTPGSTYYTTKHM